MRLFRWSFCLLFLFTPLAACQPTGPTPLPTSISRESKIPAGAVKMSPTSDEHPPQVLVSGYAQPVPLSGAVNTAGAEDSPFITPEGQTLYFFFTPDMNIPVEKQVIDGVTGLYVSHLDQGQWGPAQRVVLQDSGKLALDGCEFVKGNEIWFCSAREGYTGVHWFKAQYRDGKWQNWQEAGFPAAYQVGELDISPDGRELYYHSDRPGGLGGLDIWMSTQVDGIWQEPVNLSALNTADSEGWPALSPDGNELWFNRNYAIWRSIKVGGEWGTPQQVISPLAGEPSIDQAGNVYFVHHFYHGDQGIEADLYVAYKQ
jgi:hypothetical protein